MAEAAGRRTSRRRVSDEQLELPLAARPLLRAASLQSGSSGNCLYVETDGVRLLFDAGIAGRDAERRLAALGRTVHGVDALILSHGHADHIACAGVYQRKFGLPVYMTRGTMAAAGRLRDLGGLQDVRLFSPGETLSFGPLSVASMPTPHDADESAVFIVTCGGRRLGIMTDLGHVFPELVSAMATLDAVFLESNYDREMLARGPYPVRLKRRIAGPRGHLSNYESARLLREGRQLQWACLAHLSEQNNEPAVALRTHREISASLPLHAAGRHSATPLFSISTVGVQ